MLDADRNVLVAHKFLVVHHIESPGAVAKALVGTRQVEHEIRQALAEVFSGLRLKAQVAEQ